MPGNKIDRMIDDAELDFMLAEWAEAEVDLPEGFHDTVMTRLRTETAAQRSAKKGVIISLAERFGNKKAWVSTIAAAALVLCCLPVLQNQHNVLFNVDNNASETYEMQSRNNDSSVEDPVMMTSMLADTDSVAAPACNINGAVEKTATPVQSTYDTSYEYVNAESRAELTLEEQLTLLQDELTALESQLTALDEKDTAQRTALETEIYELQGQIKQLEQQIAAGETNPVE